MYLVLDELRPVFFCTTYTRPFFGPLHEDFLHAVAKAVKATATQQLAMGLGLAQCGDTALRAEGTKFLRTRLNECTTPPGGREAVAALPEDLGHALIFFLERQEGFAKQRAALMKQLQHVRKQGYPKP